MWDSESVNEDRYANKIKNFKGKKWTQSVFFNDKGALYISSFNSFLMQAREPYVQEKIFLVLTQ